MGANYGGAMLAIGGAAAAGGIGFYLLGAGALDGILGSINQAIQSLLGSVGSSTDTGGSSSDEDTPDTGGSGTNTTPDPTTPTCKTGEEYDTKKKKCVKVKAGKYARAYLAAEHRYMGDRPIYYSQGVVRDRAYLIQY